VSKSGLIKVLIVEPSKEPYCLEVENDLKPMQKIVGGYLESVTLSNRLVVLCNEDGLSLGLPKNNAFVRGQWGVVSFVGTYFFVAHEGGEFASLTDEDITQCLSFIYPQ